VRGAGTAGPVLVEAPATAAPRRPRSFAPAVRRALLLGVPLAYVGVLLVGPLAAIVHGAFAPGLSAFAGAITSDSALHALALTFAIALGAVLLNTVFGVAIAFVLVRDPFRGRRLLGGLVDLPFAVSPVMIGLMAMLLFGRRGWFRPVLDVLGVQVLFAWPAMVLATTFVSLPLVVRELTPVLEEVGIAEEEAALTLGASRWQTFVHVTIPNIRWGLLYGVALTVARAIGEFGAVLIVSGAVMGKTETATLLIYRALEERHDAEAHAIAVLLASVSVALLLGMELAKKRRDQALETRSEAA
jgi:sulfate transport system permease protein